MEKKQNNVEAFTNNILSVVGGFLAFVWKATISFFKNLPMRFVNFIKRYINDYKRRPKREDVSKVYVLVGYTTKANIDAKYAKERFFLILRKGLLVLIFVLLIFISINKIIPYIDVDSYKTMFGVSSSEEMIENDPFSSDNRADSGN